MEDSGMKDKGEDVEVDLSGSFEDDKMDDADIGSEVDGGLNLGNQIDNHNNDFKYKNVFSNEVHHSKREFE
jgi:hypothetical protein